MRLEDRVGGDLTLTGATVWADPDQEPVRGATVVVRSGVVAAVTAGGGAVRTAGPVHDLRGKVVTAGWWNCHVHLVESRWAGAAHAARGTLQESLDEMFLRRGFTGAVDLGSDPRNTSPLLRRIDTGELTGPTIVTAGSGIYPAFGLPFYLRPSLPWLARRRMPMPLTSHGARRAVKRQMRGGARAVKLFTGSYVRPQRVRAMGIARATAAVEVAHRHGVRVFAHPSDREGLRVAVEAGVDVLAHVADTPVGTDDLLRSAARRGMWMVPTLDMFARTVSREPGYLGPIDAALRTFVDAGGRLLFGTDVGYMSTDQIDGELTALERCGLGGRDILRSLTTAPAQALGLERAGSVGTGRRADLTVLHCTDVPDPLDFAAVAMTIKDGHVVHDAGASAGGVRE